MQDQHSDPPRVRVRLEGAERPIVCFVRRFPADGWRPDLIEHVDDDEPWVLLCYQPTGPVARTRFGDEIMVERELRG